eukprot:898291_1
MIYKCGFNVQNDDLFSESSATDSAGDSEEEDPLSKTQLFRLTVFLATRSNATISSMGDTLKGVIGILFDEDNERCAASTSTCRRWLRFKLLVLNLLVLSLNLVVEISSDDMALAWDETSKKGTSYNAVLCCYELCDKMESMVMGYVVMSGKDAEH